MINERDILFVTTTLYTKWLNYQSNIIKRLFPDSDHLIVDGKQNWPNSWFYWVDEVKKSNKKYFIHLDEDFFITNKEELIKCLEKMETDKIDLMGVADGYHEYRGANPVAINTFLLIGRVDDIKKINFNFNDAKFTYGTYDGTSYTWVNNFGINFKEEYKRDFNYPHKISGGYNFKNEQEPYYLFLWLMKEVGCKFGYLYPNFDNNYKSTNPRIDENSPDIGIHMWYTRQWNNSMDVHGMANIDRYNAVEKYLLENEC